MKIKITLTSIMLCFFTGFLMSQVPENDACIDAKVVAAFPYVDTLDATNATNNDGSISVLGCSDMNDGVWYSFIGTGGSVSINLITEDFDSEIGIYTGSCDALLCIGSIDNSFVASGEFGTIPTILGLTYYVNFGYWDSEDGAEGNIIVEFEADNTTTPLCGTDIPSNDLENGAIITEGSQQVAADFLVSANTTSFRLDTITATLLGNALLESVDITFYEDEDGLPGAQYGEPLIDVVPTSQEVIGTNFGFNFRDVIVALETPIEFTNNTGVDRIFWMQISAKSTSSDDLVGWETTSASTLKSTLAFILSDSQTGEWQQGTDECVFKLLGECTFIDGCFVANNFELADRGFTTAFFTWASSIMPEGGFNFLLFNGGDDPTTAEAVVDLNVANTANFVNLIDLIPGTDYDAYLISLCADEPSDSLKISFSTRLAPANDDLCSATALVVDEACTGAIYNNEDATTQEGEPEGECFSGGPEYTVWFSFVAPDNGSVVITTDIEPATNDDTEIAIYEAPGDCMDPSSLGEALDCSQDAGTDIEFNSVISNATLTPGATYYIQVSGYDGTQGTFCIEVQKGPDCPVISGLLATAVTQTEVELTWNSDLAATGYVVSIFDSGADPETGTAIYTQAASSDELVVVATDLTPGTNYDAYVIGDCGDRGFSEFNDPFNFSTGPATPLCGEMFLDSGGEDRSYQNNEEYGFAIEPIDVTSIITLTFSAVDIEEGFDFLRIYDGEDENATELTDSENGLLEPATFTSSTAGGKLYVTFSSDSGVIGDGWVASLSCTSSSTEDIDVNMSNVYPNPVTNILTVTSNEIIERVEIYNIVGQQMLVETPETMIERINIADFQAGTYLVKTQINGVVETKRIVKN